MNYAYIKYQSKKGGDVQIGFPYDEKRVLSTLSRLARKRTEATAFRDLEMVGCVEYDPIEGDYHDEYWGWEEEVKR
jgi:hypothetical protein